MAKKSLKKIIPITLAAISTGALAITLPLVLTSQKSNSTKDVSSIENSNNQNSTINNDSSSNVNESVEDSNKEESTIDEAQKDEVVNGSDEDDFLIDSPEITLIGDLQQTQGNSTVVFGDDVSYQLSSKLKGEFNEYSYNWSIINNETKQKVNLGKTTSNQTLSFNTSMLEKAGTYTITGEISWTDGHGLELTSETISKQLVVYPKVNVSLQSETNFKNNQHDAKISPTISFEGVNEQDYSKVENLFNYTWTKNGKQLSENLFSQQGTSLVFKLATKGVEGQYTFNVTSKDGKVKQNLTNVVNVNVEESSFNVNVNTKSSVKAGENVDLSANIQSKTRSNDSYTYKWFVKSKDAAQAIEIKDSDVQSYTLKNASTKEDNGSQYYVVAKNNATGEIQWSEQPTTVNVEKVLKENFSLKTEDGSNQITVGTTKEISVDDLYIPNPLNSDNTTTEFEWHVSVNGHQIPNLGNGNGSGSSYYYDGYQFNIKDSGKKLSIKNSGSLANISVQLTVFQWSGNKLIDGANSEKVNLTSQKNTDKYKINVEKVSELKDELASFNDFDKLVKNSQLINLDDGYNFGLFNDAKTKVLNKLGLESYRDGDFDVSFNRVNDVDGNMAFDLKVVIKDSNYSWKDYQLLTDDENSDLTIKDNVLTIKNIKTAQKSLFTVQQKNSQKSNDKTIAIQLKGNDVSESQELNQNYSGIFLTKWYYKDSSGKFEEVNKNNSKFNNVKFNDVKGKNIGSTNKDLTNATIVNGTLDLSDANIEELDGEFYALVYYDEQTSNSSNWNYIYNFVYSWNQQGFKLNK